MTELTILAMSVPGLPHAAIPIAAAKAGAIGILDLSWPCDESLAVRAARAVETAAGRNWGIKLRCGALANRLLAKIPMAIPYVILESEEKPDCAALASRLRDADTKVVIETVSVTEIEVALAMKPFAVIAKGHESGGRIGEESSFILLQRSRGPSVWSQGGIGLHSVAAAWCGGATGVVLDSQLWLARESPLCERVRSAIAQIDGSETDCIGLDGEVSWRLFSRSKETIQKLRDLALVGPSEYGGSAPGLTWREVMERDVDWSSNSGVLPIGQDAAFAAPLAKRYGSVGAIIGSMRQMAVGAIHSATRNKSLDAHSPLARSHGTVYPIVQGPMTRVSDRASFAAQVTEGGALPFLALALMRDDTIETLLEETRNLLGARPFGVGILGFVPLEIREAQLRVITAHRPPFALIAGGRPDQAEMLESKGIPTYLHVPSPGLLAAFLNAGSRRFVFEGRECGGHVGPRSSFVLWDQMTEALLNWLDKNTSPASDIHVLFAGGIHDARSSAMVAALAAPLSDRGVRIGVLLGTAYLFTEEAVATGAIVKAFQEVALRCGRTSLLKSARGHVTRCASTTFATMFEQTRKELHQTGVPTNEQSEILERLNLGRLRIATKGLVRDFSDQSAAGLLRTVPEYQQREEGLYMMGQVAALRDRTCTITELHEEVSTGGSQWLSRFGEPVPEEPRRPSAPCDVAIIGMGCMFPKAPNLDRFWGNILAKVDTIQEIPSTRWNWRDYFDPVQNAKDKIYSRWGGFLDEIMFDPVQYGMPPNSLPSIEPLQLLALETARAALEDAGYAHRDFTRDRTAVMLGVSGGASDLGHAYIVRSAIPGLPASCRDAIHHLPEWTEDSFPGVLPNVVAGRISNRFNLGGANYTVDAACASSLAAIRVAVADLESGECDMAIAGGADTQQNPFTFLAFSKTHALSPHGRCRPFDASADGIAVSEGLAMVVLKRLRDAERDGDRIYAVLKGIGAASDGKERALTAPGREGQIRALERAYARSGISPATVTCVEAHGTGTVAGDQAELESLTHVFGTAGAKPRQCAIGSVKSMIGHTKATAGLAGLIKTVLALHHKVLPPTINVDKPNALALPPESAFYVNTALRPWIAPSTDVPRRAAVSAFGFGGTNFHAVLEEYASTAECTPDVLHADWPSELLVFTGESTVDLVRALGALRDQLAAGARFRLADLACTLWRAAERLWSVPSPRMTIVVSTHDDLRLKLDRGIEILSSQASTSWPGVYYFEQPLGLTGKTAFLFPGQGSQYPDMLVELAVYFREVREVFERGDRVLADRFPRPLSTYIFPPPRFTEEEETAARAELMATRVAQPALGVAAMAAARLLRSLQIHPDMAAGHSYGEYSALCAAGAFSEDELYDISELRGRLIAEIGGPHGTMAAVEASREFVEQLVRPLDSIWIANVNAPTQTVIAGTREAIDMAMARFEAAGTATRLIAVPCAFHSPMMCLAKEPLAQRLRAVNMSGPQFDVFSNVSAAPYPREALLVLEQLSTHLVATVDFDSDVRAMYEAGARVFVEVGPRNVLSRLVDRILGDRPHAAIPLDLDGETGLLQLQHAVAHLAAHHVPMTLDRLYDRRGESALDLAALAETDSRLLVPATAWRVDGGSARPANQAAPVPAESHLESEIALLPNAYSPTAPARTPAGLMQDHEVSSYASLQTAQVSPFPTPTLDAERGQMLQGFNHVMAQILQAQRDVMLAYLKSDHASPLLQRTETRAEPKTSSQPSEMIIEPVEQAKVFERSPRLEVSAEASLKREPVRDMLMQIVSKRTGYPVNMLTPEANVESELGIDSLKITEILTAFQQACAADDATRVKATMEKLIRAKTLGTMINTLEAALSMNEATSSPKLEKRPSVVERYDATQQPTVARFTLELTPCEIHSRALPAAGIYIITDDEAGIARAVAGGLERHGCTAIIVTDGARSDGNDPRVCAANLADPDAVSELFADVKRRSGPISGLVHLLPLKHREHVPLSSWSHEVKRHTRVAFLLAKELAPVLKESSVNIRSTFTVATFAAPTNEADDAASMPRAVLGAVVKTAAAEWPNVQCRCIELGATDEAAQIASKIIDEICATDQPVDVRYRNGRRMTIKPIEARRSSTSLGFGIDHDSIVLVTGGSRGITAAVACHLAQRYQPTLLIASRSVPPDRLESPVTACCETSEQIKTALMSTDSFVAEQTPASVDAECARILRQRECRQTMAEIREAGASAHYHQVDVSDELSFSRLIESIYRRYGRIDGVIHGAGIIEDALIENKRLDSFDRVFDAKVTAAAVLSRTLDLSSLRFMVFFSSIAACFGSRGQVDYAAGNDVLNTIAAQLDRQWPARVVSIAWAPWAGIGMVSPIVAEMMKRRGVALIQPSEGVRAFDWELQHAAKGLGPIILGYGPWCHNDIVNSSGVGLPQTSGHRRVQTSSADGRA